MSDWISVDDRLPDFGVRVLVVWRPIDHEERPFHREAIIAQRTEHLPDGGVSLDSDQWWANDRHYDTGTFITYWMPLPDIPSDEDANPWIDWHGGECPVEPETLVDVEFREGTISKRIHHGSLHWEHGDSYSDIVKYRLHKAEEK